MRNREGSKFRDNHLRICGLSSKRSENLNFFMILSISPTKSMLLKSSERRHRIQGEEIPQVREAVFRVRARSKRDIGRACDSGVSLVRICDLGSKTGMRHCEGRPPFCRPPATRITSERKNYFTFRKIIYPQLKRSYKGKSIIDLLGYQFTFRKIIYLG
jgi:hypothetical protein